MFGEMKMYNGNLYLGLMEKAIQREFKNFLRINDIDFVKITESYAVIMLEQIREIMDCEALSSDDKCDEILKTITFYPVPPHID